ncbi:MAG TPA: hypothetical protein VE360_10275 [Pyrinomonadaceae bacterium]|nr:hypothetical protein [Pyrinomonadaceae bacterium]
MKKGLATLLVLLALFAAAEPASAGTCRRRVTLRRSYSRAYYPRYSRVYYPRYSRAGYARSCPAYRNQRISYYVRNRRSRW